MKKSSVPAAAHPTVTIGLDLGDRRSHFCVLDERGDCSDRGELLTSIAALQAFFLRHVGQVLIMEVGVHSPWVSRLAERTGLDVVVANPRKVALITRNERKNDRTDAELLARLGRADRKLLSPVCLGISPFDAHCWVLEKALIMKMWGQPDGPQSQHGGSGGVDTAWLAVDPDRVPSWLAGCGGTLAAAHKIMSCW